MRWVSGLLLFFSLSACGPSEPPSEMGSVEIEVEISRPQVPEPPADTPEVTKAVVDKVSLLLELTANGQLRPLIREAEKNENFQSNFGDQTHSRHWFLLRRIGVDPAENLRATLNQPHGVKLVGSELWFIWPDFAARTPEELIPETLSFQDRARLRELIGDSGIERIRAGEPYPGVRLAISETGRWVYFIHDIDTVEEP